MSSLPIVLYDSPTQTTSDDADSPTQTTENQTFNCGTYVPLRITNNYTKFERHEIKSRLALELNRTKDLINRIEEEQIGKSTIQEPKLDHNNVLVVQPISTHVLTTKRSYNRKTEKFKLPKGWKVLMTSFRKSGKPIKTYQDPEERYTTFRSIKKVQAFVKHGILPKDVKLKADVPATSDGAAGKKRNAKRKKADAPDAAVKNKKAEGWL